MSYDTIAKQLDALKKAADAAVVHAVADISPADAYKEGLRDAFGVAARLVRTVGRTEGEQCEEQV